MIHLEQWVANESWSIMVMMKSGLVNYFVFRVSLKKSFETCWLQTVSKHFNKNGEEHQELGCLIPPLLFQTYFASILFGHLWFQDIFFAEKCFLRSTFSDLGGSWGDLRKYFLAKKIMFWIFWPNKILAK